MKHLKRISTLAAAGVIALLAISSGRAPAELKSTEFGKGSTIVLVHGLGSARMSWLPVARKLLGSHHVVMLDLPGHGDSPLPDPFSLDACGDEVAAALARYDPKKTVVVGVGVGGSVAIKALEQHPKAAAGLILVETATKSPMAIPDQQHKFFMQYLDEQYEEFIRTMFDQVARDSTQAVKLRADAMQIDPRHIKAYFRYLLRADLSDALNNLQMPKMLVLSERHWPEEKPWSEVAAELGYTESKGLDVRRVKDSGFMVHMDQPDSLAALIAGFTKAATGP